MKLPSLSADHRRDVLAGVGEFVGTTAFLFLALAGAKTATLAVPLADRADKTVVGVQDETIIMVSLSFGLSLICTAWAFFRITGALFNPAITLSLWLIGGVQTFRALLLTASQLLGGIAASGLVAALTSHGTVGTVVVHPAPGVTQVQAVFLEALLTSVLVFEVLMLAAERHRGTFLAPVGIGLTLFICHLVGVAYTGCGINPARALGPSVISGDFGSTHWIYWVGPFMGSFFAVGFYLLLKALKYEQIALGADSSEPAATAPRPPHRQLVNHIASIRYGKKVVVPIVAPFDPTNPEVQQAVERGEAVVLDLGTSRIATRGGLGLEMPTEESEEQTVQGDVLGIQDDLEGGAVMMGREKSSVSLFAA